MKKGVVLSVNKYSVTFLTPDGEFEKSRRLHRDYEIGEEINYQPTENPLKSFLYFSGKKTAVISAVVTCIMLFSILSPHFSTHVSAYMTIDVNPSIELGLDDELQVVEMKGINADGKRVISQIQGWKNKGVSDVAEKIVLKTQELGYFTDSKRKIIVSKTVVEDDKKLDKQLNQEINGFTKEMPIANTEVKLIQATENDRNKAKKQGISTGKFVEQKLDEEKRKNKKSDLEKKNDNSGKKDNKVSNKAHTEETNDNKSGKHFDQYVTTSHNVTAESIKNNPKDKYAVLINKGNHSKNKEKLENKGNLKSENNAGKKEKSKIKSNKGNKEKLKIKSNKGNKGNSAIKSNPGNKENSRNKNHSGNKGNSENKGNSWNKGHSETKGNSGNNGK